jgi:hypothetical protein
VIIAARKRVQIQPSARSKIITRFNSHVNEKKRRVEGERWRVAGKYGHRGVLAASASRPFTLHPSRVTAFGSSCQRFARLSGDCLRRNGQQTLRDRLFSREIPELLAASVIEAR